MGGERTYKPGECDYFGPGDVEPTHCTTFLVQPGDVARYAGTTPRAELEYGIKATPDSPVRGPASSRERAEWLYRFAQRVFSDARLMVREPGGEWRPADTEEEDRG